ncbi:MAG: hypothetical protein ACRD4E_14120, partial [Bryobacteraceae bacterium]
VESRRRRAIDFFLTNSGVTRNEGEKEKSQPSCLSVVCNGAPQDVFVPTIKIRKLGSGTSAGSGTTRFLTGRRAGRSESMPGETCGTLDTQPSLNCAGRGIEKTYAGAKITILKWRIPVKMKAGICGKIRFI